MGKPKEDAECLANHTAKLPDGVELRQIELIHRLDQAIRQHQQCRLMKMRDQKQQKVFVAKLFQIRLAVLERRLSRLSNHREHAARAHKACAGRTLALPVPIPVIAMALFKITEIAF